MKQNNIFNPDVLFEQMTAISKAAAYDAISPEYSRLKEENEKLKYERDVLAIELKYEKQMVQALKDSINSLKPDNAESIPLGEVDQEIEDELNNRDDIKNVL